MKIEIDIPADLLPFIDGQRGYLWHEGGPTPSYADGILYVLEKARRAEEACERQRVIDSMKPDEIPF